ncbi:hypothetical protein H6F98_08805 [Microcoleus sp. FACHB-SPT15]|uniref:hypothetical protein n=1 Tax=Microcoleus sp. FACHB-SPT15 TaxID=2692830 RepID=UPI00177F9F63|nr:hypothetical protein [Microcoleus sp. FACHB-SPT15]MBD1805545.1 hypothetical protein [Microcoleus sp. FACHB-SPT15]
MVSNQLKYGIGVFRSGERAIQAFDELRNTGFPMNQICVLAKSPAPDEPFSNADISKLPLTPAGGAAAGAAVGATTGGLLALIAGMGALLVPGFGLALAVESLITVFLAGGACAAAGGFVGALRGWFLPEEAAISYNEDVSKGAYLVTVKGTKNEIHRAEPILDRWGVRKWRVYNTSSQETEH